MKPIHSAPLLALLMAASFGSARADTVKVAFIDPFSGPFAVLSQSGINAFRVAEEVARKSATAGRHTLEFVEFDNKISAQESLSQLKTAIDQGYRYVTQGIGSGATAALIEAINKHNERNPGKEVLLINWTSNDPDLTNSGCSYWHFRLDLNSDMKMEGLTTFIAKDTSIKKVYLINQSFAFGLQAARAAREGLTRKRPDLQIVGDDKFPGGQVRDFAPYIAKIRASGADSVITSNNGPDLALLIKAAKDAGLTVKFYTFFAMAPGAPSAIGSSGAEHVINASGWHPNIEGDRAAEQIALDKKRFGKDLDTMLGASGITLLREGFRVAGSTDPVKVAAALEGLKIQSFTGEIEMRKSDHQMLAPLYIAKWTQAGGKDVRYDQEATGYGWKTIQKLDTYVSAQPTSCQMKRPKG